MAAVTSLTFKAPAAVSSRASPETLVMKSAPMVSWVVEALVKTEVDEAKSANWFPRRKSGVEVALVVVPKWVVVVKGKALVICAGVAKSVPETAAMTAPPVVVLRREPEAMLEIAKFVVVAAVPVALAKVKFWRVVEEVARNDGAERTSDTKVRFAESVKAPLVVAKGILVAVREETVRFVVEAVPKYPVPETESAVELAYGNVEAIVVEVAV